MIQFQGRWAAATVLGYVEEALEEVTSSWAASAIRSSGARITQGTAPLAADLAAAVADQLGASGTLASMSERVDRIEQLLVEVRERSDQFFSAQSQRVNTEAWAVDDRVVTGEGPLHHVTAGSMEWPVALWTSVCGWRFGLAPQSKVMDLDKAEQLGRPWCKVCLAARRRWQVGDVGVPH
jgi:hypothetical protein